ncbi:MAG: Phosphate regulon transcriptional regulatory protein PhoB (SphR), partial [uncultured Thermomicrobiales bacterium]
GTHPGRRRRDRPQRPDHPPTAPGGPRGLPGVRRRGGGQRRRVGGAGSGGAGLDAAQARRPGGLPQAARALGDPDPNADRAGRGSRHRARARGRRRRLPHQAVPDARAAGPRPRDPAPQRPHRSRARKGRRRRRRGLRYGACRFDRRQHRDANRDHWRRGAGSDPEGVRPAGALPPQPRARLQPRLPAGAGLGRRLLRDRPHGRHPRPATAQKDGRRGGVDPHCLGDRLQISAPSPTRRDPTSGQRDPV